MDVIDIVLIVILVFGVIHGVRLGALAQIFSYGGMLIGLTLGALIADVALGSFKRGTVREVLALVLVLGLALGLAAVGRAFGKWSHVAIRGWAPVDGALGALVAIAAVLLSAWLVANTVADSRFTWLDGEIAHSVILASVDRAMPPVPDMYARVEAFFDQSGFPPVFSELAPPVASSVRVMNGPQADALAKRASSSMVKVDGSACGYLQEGSGFVVGEGLVLTNAHVVAGETSTEVQVDGTAYAATTIFYDPTYDVAILRTAAPLGPPLTLDPQQVTRGTEAAVLGFPNNGALTVGTAGVASAITAHGLTIYNQGSVVRRVYQIDADVEPGNSGGPLLAPDGEVIGVVFSRSTSYADVGYALASPGVLARVNVARSRMTRVSTEACTES